MAVNTLNEVKINKISSTQFDTEKTGGAITPTMETNEVFIFTDDKVFTETEKTKLSNISAGADVSTITGVKRNGTDLTPTNKVVDIAVPTKTSDLTNDSNFVSDANYNHTDSCFTVAEKTKLAGIEEGAEVNTIETVKLNGTTITPDANKAVNIEIIGATAITKIWS